jgi:hypothetical protein
MIHDYLKAHVAATRSDSFEILGWPKDSFEVYPTL